MKDQLQNLRISHLRLCCQCANRHLRPLGAPHSNYIQNMGDPFTSTEIRRSWSRDHQLATNLYLISFVLLAMELWPIKNRPKFERSQEHRTLDHSTSVDAPHLHACSLAHPVRTPGQECRCGVMDYAEPREEEADCNGRTFIALITSSLNMLGHSSPPHVLFIDQSSSRRNLDSSRPAFNVVE